MATPSEELELLLMSRKRYALYVVALVAGALLLFYIFGPLLPWRIQFLPIVGALLGLFVYTILARVFTPKRFAKIGLYSEIFVNVFAASLVAYFSGGIISPLNLALIIPIVFAIFLVGVRFGWVITITSLLILALFIFLPSGLSITKMQATAFFAIYSVLILYLTSVFLLLSILLVRLETSRKQAQERIAVLENITARLKTLDRLKTEFITRASHQLRTPLSELKWGFDALLSGTKGELQDEQRFFLQKMSLSTENLIQLVTQLLDTSRLEEQNVAYPMGKVNVEKLLQNIVERLALEIQRKRLRVSLDLAKTLYAKGEERSLEIAVGNVVENAVRYTPEGGAVSISTSQENDTLHIRIRDNGIGISPEEQKFVFTRFFRGSHASRIVSNGTGLGLSLAKDIIEKHNGKISLESQENKGTEATISLPSYQV